MILLVLHRLFFFAFVSRNATAFTLNPSYPSDPSKSSWSAKDWKRDCEADFETTMARAMYKMQVLMSPEFPELCEDPLKSMLKTCAESVFVQPSSIPSAGNGIFATRDLSNGTTVALYPVHAFGIQFHTGRCHIMTSGPEDDSYDLQDSSYTLHLMSNRPILDILAQDLKGLPFVDADPTQTITPGWWGHYLNDGSAICPSELTTQALVDDANSNDKVKDSIRATIDYYDASLEAQNAILVPFGPAPLCAVIITRDVAAGEELFVTYGHRYWLGPSFQKMGIALPDTDEIRYYESLLATQFKIWTEQIESTYSMESMQLHLTFQCIEVPNE
jgi:hypothetical protein